MRPARSLVPLPAFWGLISLTFLLSLSSATRNGKAQVAGLNLVSYKYMDLTVSLASSPSPNCPAHLTHLY